MFCLPVCHSKIQTNVQRKALLPVVSDGCETWSFTLREEHRLRVFEEDIWAQEGPGNRRVEKTAH